MRIINLPGEKRLMHKRKSGSPAHNDSYLPIPNKLPEEKIMKKWSRIYGLELKKDGQTTELLLFDP